uniref:Uncharacterized protein n=1 Tax=Prymnesium polylepis TaxID=72548 RepID=A0A7S4I8K9_9EUKA
MPRALSPPAQSQQPSPAGSALFDADDDAVLLLAEPLPSYYRPDAMITPSFAGGSTSKRTLAPTDLESHRFHLDAQRRRQQLEVLGMSDTPH